MNTRKLLTTAALVALAIGSAQSAFAETAKTTATQVQPVRTLKQQQKEHSAKMLSQISLAIFSLDFDLPKDATTHIKSARKIALALEKDAPDLLTFSEFKFGKEMYEYEGDVKDFYVPVIDDI